MKLRASTVLTLLIVLLVAQFGFAGGNQPTTEGTTTQQAATAGAGLYETTQFYTTIADYQNATGKSITTFQQSPLFDAAVSSGTLPPVEQRISEDPLVIVPLNEVGQYGGRIRTPATSPVTGSAETWTMRTQAVLSWAPDLGGVVPNIAKAFQISDDNKTFSLTLREGMKWSDGAPFTADDFVFWFKAIQSNTDIVPARPQLWEPLTNVEKVSDYEVRFTFSEPRPTVIDVLAMRNRFYYRIPFAPAHFLEKYHIDYNEDAAAQAEDAGYGTWSEYFNFIYPDEVQAQMTPGVPCVDPWVLTTVDNIGNKYFERNAYYWKIDTAGNQLPYIDGQDRLYLDSGEAIQLKAIAGEFDAVLQFAKADSYSTYVENEVKGGYTASMWQNSRGQVAANTRPNMNHPDPQIRALFNDLRFREALSLAINRAEINQVMWRGLAVTRASMPSPTVSYYEDWMGQHMTQYDPAGANRRLDEMGLEWDSNHQFRLHEDGSTITLNVEYTNFEYDITPLEELVKTYWETIGIKTTIKAIDQTLQRTRREAGELAFDIWNRDSSTELGHHSNPLVGAPYAEQWNEWWISNGEQGEEPPADAKRFYELADQFVTVALGTPEYDSIGRELLTLQSNNLYAIGIAGMAPQPALIKNALGNTPKHGVFDYDYRFWTIYHPEQWYWKQ